MKASIEDLWLNDTATTAVKRALNGARDPKRVKVPESMRKANYGIGARWQVGWIVDRKRRRKSFRDRRKAEEFAAMLEDDIRSGRYVDPADMARTVGQAGEEAFPLLVPVIKDATWNRYRRDWDNHVAPYWGELPLSALTPAALGAWIAALSDGSAASCHGIALSASSVKGIHRALSVAVGYAVENGWLPSDPLKRVTWPKTGRDAEPRVYLTIAPGGDAGPCGGRAWPGDQVPDLYGLEDRRGVGVARRRRRPASSARQRGAHEDRVPYRTSGGGGHDEERQGAQGAHRGAVGGAVGGPVPWT